jgi:hypothetical protein
MLYKLHQDNIFYDRYPKKKEKEIKKETLLCIGIYIAVFTFFFYLGKYHESPIMEYHPLDGPHPLDESYPLDEQ